MTDYIRRDDAVKIAEKYGLADGSVLGRHTGLADCIASEISAFPAADVAPVVHGKWASEAKGGVYGPVCSVCGYYIPGISFWNAPYCPKCGARMDGGNDNVSD